MKKDEKDFFWSEFTQQNRITQVNREWLCIS